MLVNDYARQVDNVEGYGIADIDKDSRIHRFIENLNHKMLQATCK